MKPPVGKGTRTFSKAVQYLERLGFSPCQIDPTNPDQPHPVGPLGWIACLAEAAVIY